MCGMFLSLLSLSLSEWPLAGGEAFSIRSRGFNCGTYITLEAGSL